MIVVIPSYQRASLCNQKTLTTLHHQIPKEFIYVYVVEEEYELYQTTLNPLYYNQIIIGKKGLVNQRHFIQHQYPEGTHIVMIDDDIEKIDLSLTKYNSLLEFMEDAFLECEKRKSFIWGVYPVYNPFFRRLDMRTNLNYIVGAFYGIINRYDADLDVTLCSDNKEDIERTIRYFIKDGIVLRFDKVGIKTKYYGTVGGLGNFVDRIEDAKIASELLAEHFVGFGKMKQRKNGMYEFKLNRSYKK